jgi:hypothetical protein
MFVRCSFSYHVSFVYTGRLPVASFRRFSVICEEFITTSDFSSVLILLVVRFCNPSHGSIHINYRVFCETVVPCRFDAA